MAKKITREDILYVFRRIPDGESITTQGIAWCLNCTEHRVRAGVSWLVLGGVLAVDELWQRTDEKNRPYKVKRYRWTGRTEINRVPRDPHDRAAMRDQQTRCELMGLVKW